MAEELTKKEKRALAKEEKKAAREKGEMLLKFRKWFVWTLALVGLVYAGYRFVNWFNSPDTRPGIAVEDMGAEHTTNITGITYNSNPPTSGPHFPVWARRGVYDRVISDGHLIHSLEHGYIVLSYNCSQVENPTSEILNLSVLAQEEATESGVLTRMKVGLAGDMAAFTPENAPEAEVELPEAFESESCRELVDNLSSFLEDWERVIVVPRLDLETEVALTAWNRLDLLEEFDETRIEAFIAAFHNRGPEQTVE